MAARTSLANSLGVVAIDNMSPGAYRLSAYGSGMAPVQGACNVAAEATAEATIELRPAVEREIVVEYAATQTPARIAVQEVGGGEVFAIEGRHVRERPFRVKLQLPLGRFTLRATSAGGRVADLAFAMPSLDANQPAVVLQAK